MKFLILNGPNMNMLGKRDAKIYGTETLEQINEKIAEFASGKGVELEFRQTNHEGQIIDILQDTVADGIVLNAGAYTHYSYAIRDAISSITVPVCEAHLSDIDNREQFRKTDVLREVCVGCIKGLGINSYFLAIDLLIRYLTGAK